RAGDSDRSGASSRPWNGSGGGRNPASSRRLRRSWTSARQCSRTVLNGLGGRAKLLEDVGHLETGPHGFRCPVGGLAAALREDAEGDRDAGLERRELQSRR